MKEIFAKNSTVTKEASNKHLLIMPEHTLSSQTYTSGKDRVEERNPCL